MQKIGLYIHIPFCKSKCYYCDFTSFEGQESMVEKYIDYLIKELDLYKELVRNKKIKTIFIGGGTPSYIDPKGIDRILKFIKGNFNVEDLEEVTMEANPGTLNTNNAKIYIKAGIDRISMGVQTLNDEILQKIGRTHTEDEVYESYRILKAAGFTNINLDFIFGLPDEKLEDVKKNLIMIKKLKPSHISYYGLILEEDTPLYNLDKRGKLNIPSDTQEREMYYLIKEELKEMGYVHYEISNFALENKECKHNILYWDIEYYIGVGLSSHSYLNNRRYWNRDNFNDYFLDLKQNKLPIEGGEEINKDIEISEFTIMGLRLLKGIDKKKFKDRFNKDIDYFYRDMINKHLNDGLLAEDERFVRLTSKGLDLSNRVEVDFLL